MEENRSQSDHREGKLSGSLMTTSGSIDSNACGERTVRYRRELALDPIALQNVFPNRNSISISSHYRIVVLAPNVVFRSLWADNKIVRLQLVVI